MTYLGEHTFWAGLGRMFIALSFAGALLAAFFYGIQALRSPAEREERPAHGLRSAGRWAFSLHSLGVLGTIGALFAALFNHWFEFDYVWRHSSLDMPMEYIASCFWEGQEGSFLLWMTWHAALGMVLMRTAKSWEYGTLMTLSLVQLFLASMLLGVYIGDLKIGSSPFVLIRELPENLGLPWTEFSDYLMRIPAFRDGQGLNPLLQNYWMVIHPPTLFLGFAAVTIPFLYAVTGLIEKRYTEWALPALPWTFFGVAILGTGVLMGGAWAYEALSFGGFWAWDPVENSSLVPWLTLVAAGHLMMVVKHKKTAPGTALFLTLFSFLLVLYSTFLTRSGILGETSVHAFVDLGLNGQLMAFLGFFTIGSLLLLAFRGRHLPKSPSEDAFSSREFWMFIGSLTLLLSAAQITFSTSIPVLNKLIGPEGMIPLLSTQMAPPADAARHYNSLQIPFALIIASLMAIGPFLRWKESPAALVRRVLVASIVSALLGALMIWGLSLTEPLYAALLVISLFAFVANADYWLRFLRGKWTAGAMAMAHMGFALVLLGALISNAKKEAISTNATYIHADFPSNENILLPLRDTVSMYPYYVEWMGERTEGHNRIFDIAFYEVETPLASWVDGERKHLKTSFTLAPFVQMNARMGNVREPSTQHYWNKDIYTYVSYADLRPTAEKEGDWDEPMEASLQAGDDIFLFNEYLLHGDTLVVQDASFDPESGALNDLDIELTMTLKAMDGTATSIILPYHLHGNEVETTEVEIKDTPIKLRFDGVTDESGTFKVTAWKKKNQDPPFILLQAFIFPYINVLWLGAILMALGSLLAVWKRIYRSLSEEKK
ncbi:MAG: hypothetical protein ABR88_03505 [Cryomorphaceae bacterium BACL7 MAG-120322-bin74]|jgi:cytochrome c-type biogenesis protein CcmF|nr:MAG: hypothetical protein ABR88_03505 [Cryomorphaceae bacterium BACL7 MAG-120322-bin74]KRO82874.1 MAG: hypothetical protein ABR87_07175 [Cryomorphaceae bacterium BACL7 MAG-121220-bin83]